MGNSLPDGLGDLPFAWRPMKWLSFLLILALCACGDHIRDDRAWLVLYAFHFEHASISDH